MVTRRDYPEEAVRLARSVLIELVHLLGEYADAMVLVGGWVPEFLFTSSENRHFGSTDIDLALNPALISEEGYRSIRTLLLNRGYLQGAQPYIFYRHFSHDGRHVRVEVDFLSGEYGGTGRSHRHQKIQDIHARKARGCDLCFEDNSIIPLEGDLPEGGRDGVNIRVAGLVPFLVMKGAALSERLKEKDAWDIYYCLKNFPGGLDALAEVFQFWLHHGLVREGLKKIASKFASPEHIGPKFVADFEELDKDEGRELLQRDAFERVQYLMRKLGVESET